MKFLTRVLIVSDDKGIISNPTGRELFYGSSMGLINNTLFTTDTFQTYLTTRTSFIKNETIWYNGESFPFMLNDVNYDGALSLINSSLLINSFTNSNTTILSYNNISKNPIKLDNTGYLILDKTKGLGDFILNDFTSTDGKILYIKNNYVYWSNVGPTVSTTAEGFSLITGLSNTRSFSATFSFRTGSIYSLLYSNTYGWPATSSIGGGTFGATSSTSGGFNFVDIYHNMNNEYPVITFWGFTSSSLYTSLFGIGSFYRIINNDVVNNGIGPSFSVQTYMDRIRLSFVGSFSSAIQVNIMG
jgi:hypothetical protein